MFQSEEHQSRIKLQFQILLKRKAIEGLSLILSPDLPSLSVVIPGLAL